ncbi:hypothetical protein ACWGPO_02335 [Achromobacter animicus]|nr:hypothetical protein [Achromobacter animicus]
MMVLQGPSGQEFDGEIIPGGSICLYDLAVALSRFNLALGGIYAERPKK